MRPISPLLQLALALALAACGSAQGPHAPQAKPQSPQNSVSLSADEVDKMGILTTPAKSATYSPEAAGYGVVMQHDGIAQAVAELGTALAMERQSRLAYDRGRHLAGGPGAMPADTQDIAARQVAIDEAALALAQRRLSSTLGENPPWRQDRAGSPQLAALASGRLKLLRATFPFGSLSEETPQTLRLAHISSAQAGKRWIARPVWRAPADASVPGKSWFALLPQGEFGEGERVLAWAPVGAAESGAEVPAAAIVITAGKYWCYVRKAAGTFVRTAVSTASPTADGYFVKEGIEPGEQIVIRAAGLLLARETNPSTD